MKVFRIFSFTCKHITAWRNSFESPLLLLTASLPSIACAFLMFLTVVMFHFDRQWACHMSKNDKVSISTPGPVATSWSLQVNFNQRNSWSMRRANSTSLPRYGHCSDW